MPKDATKNIERYKVRGGQFNEFDYSQNQKALADENLEPAVKNAAKKTTKSKKAAKAQKKK